MERIRTKIKLQTMLASFFLHSSLTILSIEEKYSQMLFT